MKKYFFTLGILIPLSLYSQHQYIGEEHGLKVASFASPLLPGDAGLKSPITLNNHQYKGYTIGILALLNHSPRWYWQTGLQVTTITWIQNSNLLQWAEPADTLPARMRYINHYSWIEIPLGFRFYLNPGKKLKFYLHPCLNTGFLFLKKRTETIVRYNGLVTTENRKLPTGEDHRLRWNAATGAGLEWQIYSRAAFFAEPFYFINLNPTVKSGKNRFKAGGVQAGFIYKL